MGSSNPKRRDCRFCGRDLGLGEYVEIRVADWKPEEVPLGDKGYRRWRSKSMAIAYLCPVCAMHAVDRIYEPIGGKSNARKQR